MFMPRRVFLAVSCFVGACAAPVMAQVGEQAGMPAVVFRSDADTDFLTGYTQNSPPSLDSRERADERLRAYADALARRDYPAAYAMLRLSFQSANPRVDWEMGLRNRGELWASGKLQILRSSWMRDPAGQPSGAYVAYDFMGTRPDGAFDCGYIVLHQPFEKADFSVVRTESNYVAAEFGMAGMPHTEVLGQLPCFLGEMPAAKP